MKNLKKSIIVLSAAMLFLSCKNTANEAGVVEDSQQATIDSLKMQMEQQQAEMAKQKTIDSMQAVAAREKNNRPVVVHSQAPAAAPAEQKKKGWSGAAKGAVIGAGVGAVSGALIDKDKPGRGAVIGGLAGGGLGAGTGAVIDSEKKKKEAQK